MSQTRHNTSPRYSERNRGNEKFLLLFTEFKYDMNINEALTVLQPLEKQHSCL